VFLLILITCILDLTEISIILRLKDVNFVSLNEKFENAIEISNARGGSYEFP
jgi:hypothetical protein